MNNKMSDYYFQFQNIGFHLKNKENQYTNIFNQIQMFGIQNNANLIQNLGIEIINVGIQMLNVGIDIPNNNMNIFNIKEQIQNIQMQIQNIIQKMDMGMNINMNKMMINNIKNNMNINNFKKKMNIIFRSTSGLDTLLVLDYGTTINEMLKCYLKKIGKPEIIDNNSKVRFMWNSKTIDFNDNTNIEIFFNFNHNPYHIIVEFR